MNIFGTPDARDAGGMKMTQRQEAEQVPFPKYNAAHPRFKAQFRAMFQMRMQSWLAASAFALGSYFMAYPTFKEHWSDIMGTNIPMGEGRKVLPGFSADWWINEWRKGLAPWRRAEGWNPMFFESAFAWLRETTGRSKLLTEPELLPFPDGAQTKLDVATLKRIREEHPLQGPSVKRALVPLCGDSMIMYHLANRGYAVDGVDASDVGIRAFSDKIEAVDPQQVVLPRIQLHWSDIFAPSLWQKWPHHAFDVIWDREALSTFPPDGRDDYAFLLKRALKPDGVMYVEGIDRTPKVKDNLYNGPPFQLHKEDLEVLFPSRDGYMVKCQDIQPIAAKDLPAEALVMRRIPKELYARPFHCAVTRDASKATY